MANLNSKGEFFQGKKIFDNMTHHSMPKINFKNKKRRRVAYKGIVNQVPVKSKVL